MIINSEKSLLSAVDEITESYNLKKYVEISIKIGGKRGLSQNALSHVWYSEIEKSLHWNVGEAKRYCKYHFGIPILRAEDIDFNDALELLKRGRYTYDQKLKMMDILPVTSRMSKDQMKRYLNDVQMHFAAQRVVLEGKGEYLED